MTGINNTQTCRYKISETDNNGIIVYFIGELSIDTSASILSELIILFKKDIPSSLIIDLGNVTYFDDFGAFVLIELKKTVNKGKGVFSIVNSGDKTKDVLSLVDFDSYGSDLPVFKKRRKNIFVGIGEATINEANNIKFMVSFLGSLTLSMIHVLFHPKSLRVDDTITLMQKNGVDALPIVALISFLLGLIMAFMSSIQLQQFGANIYVASLVALAMVSELGPIMTAIVVAGRTGSSYAAEIGTMQVSEEIDALFSMGFNPTLFLGVPRTFALMIVLPLLTIFSDIFAILGGLVVGVFILGLTPNSYIMQTIETLSLLEITWGFLKSLIFAFIVACVGCFRGFQARGGASAVGNAATSAVVSGIFLIILFDSIIAVIRSYW
ncbi:MAG: STAS domain-containing protein [Desulfobacterales bacterium]|jgi:phospholipid/cholesterol/gamma-HCH transport system permease protein|nr:STAS domain-containing protein [Desulfobacteraceae bacterium]MBT4363041.1 STAS domain-containing protein [Desulfobacteraceae bacterium]MBT7085809.1 STAS domain-containing protein [Desulfobacterales bacterium]MBT7697964.1 STAS domain-containing protein [Desulfobacterales bacterium]